MMEEAISKNTAAEVLHTFMPAERFLLQSQSERTPIPGNGMGLCSSHTYSGRLLGNRRTSETTESTQVQGEEGRVGLSEAAPDTEVLGPKPET